MMGSTVREEELKIERRFLDIIFSWSISDIRNDNLYKDKVQEIPKTFSSVECYLNSFIFPLLEETREDLYSNMSTRLSSAPAREVFRVKPKENEDQQDCKPPDNLFYEIIFQKPKENEEDNPLCGDHIEKRKEKKKSEELYDPQCGDLIALTDRRPKTIDDLNTPTRPYLIAMVRSVLGSDHIVVLSADYMPHYIGFEEKEEADKVETKDDRVDENRSKLFVVYLANMTTNLRIWVALNSSQRDTNIIKKVLQADFSVGPSCAGCSSKVTECTDVINSKEIIRSFNLNDSQQEAVLSVIATRVCCHQNSVKLIWGPPGTGKTKSVGSLLFALLKIKCRTLTCAPTNVAVVGVASRIMSFVKGSLENYPYGLGDIVLIGNCKRLKIVDNEELSDIFLDDRVLILSECFSVLGGWSSILRTLICLLEDPKEQFKIFLDEVNKEFDELMNMNVYVNNESKNEIDCSEFLLWYKMANLLLKKWVEFDFVNNDLESIFQNLSIDMNQEKDSGKLKIFYDMIMKLLKEMKEKRDRKGGNIFTFEEFFLTTYNSNANKLILHMPSLYTHLPTSLITLEVAKNMMTVGNLLKTFETLVKDVVGANKDLMLRLEGIKLSTIRLACLQLLEIIQGTWTFSPPVSLDPTSLCLNETTLIFSTASTSAKLHTESVEKIELLIIDEAAQLKECESAIPLQLPGLHHAILVDDERQLPAMVQSKICGKALFGRSLFQRLVLLGHAKHLLNVQYRMHPSISQFPNMNFYNNKVKDGPNVKQTTYEKHFLKGNMFGPFSFINLTQWKEDQDNGHSLKNLLEVAVVVELVATLFKECRAKRQKVSIGCISPYKAQAFAIKEKLGSLYNEKNRDFSVKVNSVDGFQGSEEDVIIISTVRSNGNGSIGFLSNFQRTNVALTRARYCCWVLGNEATLLNSHSDWKKLVLDAKRRDCFYNATDDENLNKAIKSTLLELGQLDSLFKLDSILSKQAKWKICFSNEFVNSMKKIKDSHVREKVLSHLTQLSTGWRCPEKDKIVTNATGTCSVLMEVYNVNGEFVLIWSVDILKEHSQDVQVLKVWEILQKHRILPFTTYLNRLFGNYTVDAMTRCQVKEVKGNLTLPVTWPVDSNAFYNTNCNNADPNLSLSSQFAGLTLKNSRGTKDEGFWNTRRQRKW